VFLLNKGVVHKTLNPQGNWMFNCGFIFESINSIDAWGNLRVQVTLFSGFVNYDMVRNAYEGEILCLQSKTKNDGVFADKDD
jgi:hypothetical protein